MRVGVFDAVASGHHPSWVPPVVAALATVADVTLFASESLAERLPELGCELEVVDDATVEPGPQLDLLARLARSGRVDRLLHLYGVKPVLREWLRRPPLDVPAALVVTHAAMLHHPGVYGERLSVPERANAIYKELLVRRWRRRADADAIFTMEQPVVERWSRRRGAPPYYWPEPPVSIPAPIEPAERRGCAFCGALRASKNLDGVASALALAPTDVKLVVAGEPQPGYEEPLARAIATMRSAGATVDLRARWHSSAELLTVLAGARCLLAPYLRHRGTSRTLLEAALAGTPVIAHGAGSLGYIVERHGLGLTVDCSDPGALREAIVELTATPDARLRYQPALAAFVELHSPARFAAAITAPFAAT